MKLYVDDMRPAPSGWALARTVRDAQAILDRGDVEEISLDYYIGDGEEETFLPVAHAIVHMPRARRPRRVFLHTSSGAGASRLAAVLQGHVEEILRAP